MTCIPTKTMIPKVVYKFKTKSLKTKTIMPEPSCRKTFIVTSSKYQKTFITTKTLMLKDVHYSLNIDAERHLY